VASCRIEWKRSAERDLRRIDHKQIPRIVAAVERLARNPTSVDSRKLVGAERVYRIRVGDYRVIYEYDAARGIVCVFHVRHRREAYR
jgi:mRNA interferase RelE/StbE